MILKILAKEVIGCWIRRLVICSSKAIIVGGVHDGNDTQKCCLRPVNFRYIVCDINTYYERLNTIKTDSSYIFILQHNQGTFSYPDIVGASTLHGQRHPYGIETASEQLLRNSRHLINSCTDDTDQDAEDDEGEKSDSATSSVEQFQKSYFATLDASLDLLVRHSLGKSINKMRLLETDTNNSAEESENGSNKNPNAIDAPTMTTTIKEATKATLFTIENIIKK